MADNKKTTKKTTKRTVVHRDRVDIVKLCAFWGIFIAAILFVASGILGFFDLGNVGTTIISVFNLIGKLAHRSMRKKRILTAKTADDPAAAAQDARNGVAKSANHDVVLDRDDIMLRS